MISSLCLILSALLIHSSTGCRHNNTDYRDGETWIQKDAFLMKCSMPGDGSWRVEVIGCKSPSGATIPVNSTIVEGDDEWMCTSSDNGRVMLQQGVSAHAKCGAHEFGEQWREKSFMYECGRGGHQKLIACIGEGGQQIPVGESREIKGYLVKCEQYENGTVVIHGTRQKPGSPAGTTFKLECIDSKGKHHDVGSWWIDNHRFNKTCLPSGKIDVLNCISKDGHKIPLNNEVIINDIKFVCEKTKDGAIRFASGPVDSISR